MLPFDSLPHQPFICIDVPFIAFYIMYLFTRIVTFIIFSKDFIYLFLDRGGRRETEGEKLWSGCLFHTPARDLGHNAGPRPNWELNWRPFGSHALAQSTEPHQPGVLVLIHFIFLLYNRGKKKYTPPINSYCCKPDATPALPQSLTPSHSSLFLCSMPSFQHRDLGCVGFFWGGGGICSKSG